MDIRHVRVIEQGALTDLVGPAEGQYTTVSFAETLVSDYLTQGFCLDSYSFELKEASEVCFEITKGEAWVSGGSIMFQPIATDTCVLGEPIGAFESPAMSGSQCYQLLPGSYELFVAINDLDGGDVPSTYNVTLESTALMYGVDFVADDACNYVFDMACYQETPRSPFTPAR